MRRSTTFDRAKAIGEYVLKTGSTVRAAAKIFGVSKSTVHKDISERLFIADRDLFYKVREIADKNLSERHIRGGNATKLKYSKEKVDI